MDVDEAILLALEGLRASLDEGASLTQVEVCTLVEGKGFTRLLPEEIQKYAARLPPPSGAAKSSRS